MSDDRHPSTQRLEAMHVPTARIVLAGNLVALVALVLTSAVPALHEGERHWWPLCALVAFVCGMLGWAYVRRGRGNAADA